jgi:Flp pilus assembly protein TadG
MEMALVAPMMLLLLAGVVDFGRAYYEEIMLSNGVAAAGQYALLNASSINATGATSLASTLGGIVANANGTNWANATVTVNDGATAVVSNGSTTSSGTAANANSCWCPTGSAGSWSWGTAATCGSSCSGGTLAGKFVAISGTRSFTAIFTALGLIGNITLQQSMMVQAY